MLNKINTTVYVGDGLYKEDLTKWNEAVKENAKETIEKEPNAKWMFDPFVGYIKKIKETNNY